jgi:uncharacterized membrane protein YbhN (UPF0104 family)
VKRHLRFLGPTLVLILLVGALFLLYYQIKDFNFHEVVYKIHHIPTVYLIAAVGLTVLNYLVLIGYDWLNIRYLGYADIPLRKIALASLTSYMVSNTFGMLLGGTAVRYRFYSSWGLSALRVAELIALLGLTFWLGIFALAGFLFVAAPFPMPPQIQAHVPCHSVIPLGVTLLAFVGVYLGLSAFWRRPIKIFKWQSQLPPLRISLYQILISSADITIAGGVLYVLLPPEFPFEFPSFLGVYLLAVVASVLAHVPAQGGVLESTIIGFFSLQLAQNGGEAVLAALVVYRAIYTFFPLLIAAVLLGIHEIYLYRAALATAVRAAAKVAHLKHQGASADDHPGATQDGRSGAGPPDRAPADTEESAAADSGGTCAGKTCSSAGEEEERDSSTGVRR